VRGHAADALEKTARSHPEWVLEYLPALRRAAIADPVAMVRWHLAMVFGHLAGFSETRGPSCQTLEQLLHDRSATVRSWAVTSLCIIGRMMPKPVAAHHSTGERPDQGPEHCGSQTGASSLGDPD